MFFIKRVLGKGEAFESCVSKRRKRKQVVCCSSRISNSPFEGMCCRSHAGCNCDETVATINALYVDIGHRLLTVASSRYRTTGSSSFARFCSGFFIKGPCLV